MVHTTFQAGGMPGKVARFREGSMWKLDKADYFSEPVLTYQNDVKASTWSPNIRKKLGMSAGGMIWGCKMEMDLSKAEILLQYTDDASIYGCAGSN